ncbi:hypothetical protein [Streptomyces sp. PvR018]|uniref:hypothetical protein n=1 Tax=Streptomyces sp. PvR018 TaxID=3156442 RepID=UPI0033923DCE
MANTAQAALDAVRIKAAAEDVDWPWLSPLMREWSWGIRGEFWQTRHLLATLRDIRLANLEPAGREPVCIVDALGQLATRTAPEPNSRTGPVVGSSFGAALPRGPRVVLATLQSAHSLLLLVKHRLNQQTRAARDTGVEWETILSLLSTTSGDGEGITRQAVQNRWKTIERREAVLSPWESSAFMARFKEVIRALAAEYVQEIAKIKVPNILELTKSAGASNKARIRLAMADITAARQQFWEDLNEPSRIALSAIQALNLIKIEIEKVVQDLVYEARYRKSSWGDIGRALGVSRQSAHEKWVSILSGRSGQQLREHLHGITRLACVVASNILESPTATEEDITTAELFYSPIGVDSAYRYHQSGCCIRKRN